LKRVHRPVEMGIQSTRISGNLVNRLHPPDHVNRANPDGAAFPTVALRPLGETEEWRRILVVTCGAAIVSWMKSAWNIA
jgi:hypothetical protein